MQEYRQDARKNNAAPLWAVAPAGLKLLALQPVP
jgi:hypothetical protein